MVILAWVLGILGGLCAVMGIITALAVIPDIAALGWLFWMVLAAILLLATIAATLSRSEYE